MFISAKTTTVCFLFEHLVIRRHSDGPSIMNTLHKSLTITFLAVSIFISGINVGFVGKVRDQAELSGVLETLYELHLSILLVEYKDE
jgi:hypothetical protein